MTFSYVLVHSFGQECDLWGRECRPSYADALTAHHVNHSSPLLRRCSLVSLFLHVIAPPLPTTFISLTNIESMCIKTPRSLSVYIPVLTRYNCLKFQATGSQLSSETNLWSDCSGFNTSPVLLGLTFPFVHFVKKKSECLLNVDMGAGVFPTGVYPIISLFATVIRFPFLYK